MLEGSVSGRIEPGELQSQKRGLTFPHNRGRDALDVSNGNCVSNAWVETASVSNADAAMAFRNLIGESYSSVAWRRPA